LILVACLLLAAPGGDARCEEVVLQQGVSPAGYAGCRDTTLVDPGGRKPADRARDGVLQLAGTRNRLLIRFELPPALKGKRIDSAELRLFFPRIDGFKTTHVEFICARVLRDWNERADWIRRGTGGTWDDAGGSYDTTTDFHNGRPKGAMDSESFFAAPQKYWVPPTWLPHYVPKGGRWVAFDVTPAAAGWLKGDLANHGLCVVGIPVPDKRFKNNARSLIPGAEYEKDRALRPKLVIRLAGRGPGYRAAMLTPLRRYSERSPRYRYRGGDVSAYELGLARREYENFQVWVKARRADLKGLRFQWSDLVDAKTHKRIAAENLRCFRQPLVQLQSSKRLRDFWRNKRFWLPDPLLPAGAVDLRRGSGASFWFTLYAPPETPAGTYETTLRIRPANAPARKLKLTARVWDYAIPKHWNFRTMGQMIWEEVRRFYGQLTPEIRRNYIDFLLDHRFAPTEQYRDKLSPNAEDIPYCVHRGCNIIYLAGSWRGNVESLKARYETVRKLAPVHLALVYIGDETSDYAKMRGLARQVHANCPGSAAMIGGSKPRPELIGHIDIWDVSFNSNKVYGYGEEDAQDPAAVRQTIRRALDRGEDFYFYDATGDPMQDSFMGGLEGPVIAARSMFWTAWKYGFNGYELYCYNQWKRNTRGAGGKKWPEIPWHTVSWGDLNCSGMMFYPAPGGRPASSIRLELARDGIEDWESLLFLRDCLAALKAHKGAAAAKAELARRAQALLAVPDSVVRDFRTWSRDPAVLQKARDDTSALIEEIVAVAGEDACLKAAADRRAARRKLRQEMLRARRRAAVKGAEKKAD